MTISNAMRAQIDARLLHTQTSATDAQIWAAIERACAHEAKPLGAMRFSVKSRAAGRSEVSFGAGFGMALVVQWSAPNAEGQRMLSTAFVHGLTRRQWYFVIPGQKRLLGMRRIESFSDALANELPDDANDTNNLPPVVRYGAATRYGESAPLTAMRSPDPSITVFQVFGVLGVALLWLGLAVPLSPQQPSLFQLRDTHAGLLLALVAIPVLLGVVAARTSRFLAGIGAGVAAWAGVATTVLWVEPVAQATTGPSFERIHLSVGAYCLIAASASLLIGAIASQPPLPERPDHTNPVIATLGTIAVALVAIGALLPPTGVRIGDWVGGTISWWIGSSFILLVGAVFLVGIRGFLAGVWGIGVLTGFFGAIAVGTVIQPADGVDLVGLLTHTTMPFSRLATDSFNATFVLIAVHAVWLLIAELRPVLNHDAEADEPVAMATSNGAGPVPSTPEWWKPSPPQGIYAPAPAAVSGDGAASPMIAPTVGQQPFWPAPTALPDWPAR